MTPTKWLLVGVHALACSAFAQTSWNGYAQTNFDVGGRAGFVVAPKTAAAGNPWIWRAEFFGHEPQGDLALLAKGWHVAYYKVSDMYGAPPAIEAMHGFHDHVEKEFGLAKRAWLEGFSRGGLYAFNYAATYPDNVAGLYLDAPVLDIRSWPGGKGKGKFSPREWEQCLKLYGVTEDSLTKFKVSPLDSIEPVARARIPIIAVCGDADEVVPFAENTGVLQKRYRELNGDIKVILKPNGKHHPHSLPDPTPIVEFILKHTP